VELLNVNTIFPSMPDTYNSFSKQRTFPSRYA